jgi:hypothetical protein
MTENGLLELPAVRVQPTSIPLQDRDGSHFDGSNSLTVRKPRASKRTSGLQFAIAD